MQFIVIATGDKAKLGTLNRDQLNDLVKHDVAWTKQMYKDGTLRTMWSRTDDIGPVVIFEAANEAEVQKLIEGWPLVREGYIPCQIIPIAPYGGFVSEDGGNDTAMELA